MIKNAENDSVIEKWKAQTLPEEYEEERMFTIREDFSNQQFFDMIGVLRLKVLGTVEGDTMEEAVSYVIVRDEWYAISFRNEIKTMQLLSEMCDEAIRAYPTPLERDLDLIKTDVTHN